MKKVIIVICCVLLAAAGWGQAVTVDSYNISNAASSVPLYAGSSYERGQTFTCTNAVRLDSAVFYFFKIGTPTGSAYCNIYAHTGTYGTDGIPTGSALATSDAYNVTGITATAVPGTKVKFNFSGTNKIILDNATYYVVTVSYNTGNASNCINMVDDNTSPAASGNAVRYDGANWYTTAVYDFCFYVYGIYQIKKISGVLDANTKKVAGVADASIKKISGKTK